MFHRVSPHLWHVTLREAQQSKPAPHTLKIKLGEAFPPTHPTTRLCLDLVQEALEEKPINILADVGCGSGILGLAAAVSGVPLVVGTDTAWEAVTNTRLNARENAPAHSFIVIQGSTECLKGRFDLVVANLPWEVQLEKTKEFDRLAGPEGSLILSGFYDRQEGILMEQYRKLKWSLHRRLVKYFWHPELPSDISFNWVAWFLKR